MGTVGWLILGVALGMATPFVVLRLQHWRDMARAGGGSGPVSRARQAEVARPGNPFAAVSIRPCAESPCTAVLQMHHIRFLAVRAPPLPVPGCDRQQCGCRYVRHADRRTPGDRRNVFARFGGLIPNVGRNRRSSGEDRRQSR